MYKALFFVPEPPTPHNCFLFEQFSCGNDQYFFIALLFLYVEIHSFSVSPFSWQNLPDSLVSFWKRCLFRDRLADLLLRVDQSSTSPGSTLVLCGPRQHPRQRLSERVCNDPAEPSRPVDGLSSAERFRCKVLQSTLLPTYEGPRARLRDE